MPIIRGDHYLDDHFTQIPNHYLRDSRLSFKARGLLSLIMSHRTGWSLSINSLAEQNKEGRDSIRSAIQELEDLGYLARTQANEGGRFGEAIWITQDPSGLPMTGFPTTVNPTTKNNNLKEEQVKNTKEENTQKAEESDSQFYEFWNAYPRSEGKATALKAYQKALKKVSHSQLMEALEAYKAHNTRHNIIFAHATTWLNGERWEDDYGNKIVAEQRTKAIDYTEQFLAEQAELAKKAAPPPKCEHGNSLARCPICLAR